MKTGLQRATIRIFDPNELARGEKERLFAALEAFANLDDNADEFLAFGKQNPNFFPVTIRHPWQFNETPLAEPCSVDSVTTANGEKKRWVKNIAWEPVCHKLALFYRDCLRLGWVPPGPGPYDIGTGENFEILLGLETGYKYAEREDALRAILSAYEFAEVTSSPIYADWKTGSFIYMPHNDFQRAVYILFREGWRAKTCVRCSHRFIAGKPLQRYCSTRCTGEARRERNLAWWNKHGKMWRRKRKPSPRRKAARSMKKGR